MAFCTSAQVKASVGAALHKSAADLNTTIWDQVIGDAITAAYDQIKMRFLPLGYTLAQIDAWDMGYTFNLMLARYQAIMDSSGDKDQVGEWRAELDYWRGKLDEVTTIIDGSVVDDPEEEAGTINHGTISTTSDLFRLDPDDDRRGAVTEW